MPGDLSAFRIEELRLTPGEIASYYLARGRDLLVWVIICATEASAELLWMHLGPLTEAARPPVPWMCVQLLEGMRAQTPEDVSWMGEFERCSAWAALEFFGSTA